MAEKIVSPGVFTRERDLSFLPVGIGEIGAALIGPTLKGPAFVPTMVESFEEFELRFGTTTTDFYTPYTAKEYLTSAGRLTIVRILGQGGYLVSSPVYIKAVSGSLSDKVVAVLHPTKEDDDASFGLSVLGTGGTGSQQSSSAFVLELSGSATGSTNKDFSASLASANVNYITKVFGQSPKGAEPAHVYLNAKNYQQLAAITGSALSLAFTDIDYKFDYQEAITPWVTSQKLNNSRNNLFKAYTLSHGTNANTLVKIAITNIKAAGSVAGSDYGSFTLLVRGIDGFDGSTDTDRRPEVRETFSNLNLDADSPNFIARVIGDQFITTDSAGKVTVNGDYPNNSKYIRISVTNAVADRAVSPDLVPFGYATINQPIPVTAGSWPSASVVKEQTLDGAFNTKVHYGFDFDFTNTDNRAYLNPLPKTNGGPGLNVSFSLDEQFGHPSASGNFVKDDVLLSPSTGSIDQRKFVVPFQEGFDGFNPATPKNTGADISATNTMGFDLSTVSALGTVAYKKAINAVSNPDEYDINMLVTPGVILGLHSSVITSAKDMVEDRADAFYVIDVAEHGSTITTATTRADTLDTNYAATYYPWVKIFDSNVNKDVWVPPSVVLAGVIAFNDKVSHEWFAPAGLTRGGLTNVTEVKTRLTQAERDTLYEARVNPIAVFPDQGPTVWGQKTLQGKPSALDRVNVRRLLISLKKFIASSTRFLVFEQNTAATRNRFLNIVNPFLESVQQRSGLSAFKVVMDESNNTPDVIDRNQLVGQIFIQPTRTAEFIIIDFNILPTGATFPE